MTKAVKSVAAKRAARKSTSAFHLTDEGREALALIAQAERAEQSFLLVCRGQRDHLPKRDQRASVAVLQRSRDVAVSDLDKRLCDIVYRIAGDILHSKAVAPADLVTLAVIVYAGRPRCGSDPTGQGVVCAKAALARGVMALAGVKHRAVISRAA